MISGVPLAAANREPVLGTTGIPRTGLLANTYFAMPKDHTSFFALLPFTVYQKLGSVGNALTSMLKYSSSEIGIVMIHNARAMHAITDMVYHNNSISLIEHEVM